MLLFLICAFIFSIIYACGCGCGDIDEEGEEKEEGGD